MADHIVIRDSLSILPSDFLAALARNGWLVSATATPASLQAHIERYGAPSLLISTDVVLSDEEWTIIDKVRSNALLALLAIVPAEEGEWLRNPDALWLHADDFVATTVDESELVLRVRRLLNLLALRTAHRQQGQEQKDASPVAVRYQYDTVHMPGRSWLNKLSSTEVEIVRKLEQAQGKAVPVEDLAESVSAETNEARINGLRVHISRLRNKLEANALLPPRIVTVRGIGYRMEPPEQM
ncbi:MAG: winged helix-turn-helix domain-containing protein [Caldilineaceae bacterium]|nr:winged helix-turn-helix domain-containing protein [Caldilineaceae bacterium]